MATLEWLDAVARELMLFAGVGLLVGGLDDLAVDACYAALRLWRPRRRLMLATLRPAPPTRFAILVPAWDEAAVIGAMLRTALARFDRHDFRLFVGAYANDAATIAAVQAVPDTRLRLVVTPGSGPTTKADNLNNLWRALAADEWRADAVVLHDAEDVVHQDELTVFAALLCERDVVQLPVLPIVARGSPLVSGHYADEFAESHTRSLTVRGAVGAAMPLAGVGCAILTPLLERIAAARGGGPFAADSLTEDYELGLHLAAQGGRGCFARVREESGGRLIAVRAIFPGDLNAAVRQKARWMTGIALAGWDRTGWARPAALGDHWMRLRDRRAPLAMLVLAAAYLAAIIWSIAALAHWVTGRDAAAYPRAMAALLLINGVLLVWRLAMRMVFTGRAYGLAQAIWSAPRFIVGNAVALLAAPRALLLYGRLLRGRPPVWDKTAHAFPAAAELG